MKFHHFVRTFDGFLCGSSLFADALLFQIIQAFSASTRSPEVFPLSLQASCICNRPHVTRFSICHSFFSSDFVRAQFLSYPKALAFSLVHQTLAPTPKPYFTNRTRLIPLFKALALYSPHFDLREARACLLIAFSNLVLCGLSGDLSNLDFSAMPNLSTL
jgi:hypothetical protein